MNKLNKTPEIKRKDCLYFFSYLNRSKQIILLLMFSMLSNTFLYSQTIRKELLSIAEPDAETEFFRIKQELNITTDEFIKNYLKVLDLTPNSEMKLLRVEKDELGYTHSRYQQYYNNKKVIGGEMIIHEKAGRVKYVNGHYMKSIPNTLSPSIEETAGLSTALKQIKSTNYSWLNKEAEENYKKVKKNPNATLYPHGELMFVPADVSMKDLSKFILAWKYSINVSPQTESYEVYVNASTGEILKKIPLAYDCNAGSSTTIWNGVRTIYTQLSGGSYRTLGDCNSAQIHTMNGNGNDNGVGATYYTDADNTWPNTVLGNYIAQTHWGAKVTRDYYSVVHSREGYDNAGHDFTSYINAGFSSNAYWTPSTEAASFGGTSTGANPYCNLDVVGHEHTHGMVAFTSNLTYSYESGALNESFADCLGEAIEEYILGPTNWIHRFEIGGGNRSLINPNAKGHPDTYLGTNWYTGSGDAGGVHTNSGVQNFWFYLLSEGGSGTNDNGDTYNVSGITIDKARLIAYRTMINLVAGSQYADARTVSIQAAMDLYGTCSNEVVQTTNAWRAVGVGGAYVAPAPLLVLTTTTTPSICKGESATVSTFLGTWSNVSWSPGFATGSPTTLTPSATTIYTVTATNSESCPGIGTRIIYVNKAPELVEPSKLYSVCEGSNTIISASSTSIETDSLFTSSSGTNGVSANMFDIHATKDITIQLLKMQIVSGTSVDVYYKTTPYGNTNVTSSVGWIKLGGTVTVTPAGIGNLTNIPITTTLSIPAGSTYGFMIASNGSNRYTDGTTVGATLKSNPDLYITQGHGGSGFGGTFSFPNSPRNFDGEIVYTVNNVITGYAWSPATGLSSVTSSLPTVTPTTSSIYTVTITDGNGCTNTGTRSIDLLPAPNGGLTTFTPTTICLGETTTLNYTSPTGSSCNGASQLGFAGTFAPANWTLVNTNSNGTVNTASAPDSINLVSSNGLSGAGTTDYSITATCSGFISFNWRYTTIDGSFYDRPRYAINSNVPIEFESFSTTGGSNQTGFQTILVNAGDVIHIQAYSADNIGGACSIYIKNFKAHDQSTPNHFVYWYDAPSGGSYVGYNNVLVTPSNFGSISYYGNIIENSTGCSSLDLFPSQPVFVNKLPFVSASSSPTTICEGATSNLISSASSVEVDSLETPYNSNNGNAGNVFDITTTKAITITDFRMNINSGTQAEVWYKAGGYGGTTLTSNTGWTKLGATMTISPAGMDLPTIIPTTANLSIPAGQTYGIAIVCDGSNRYTNGTAVGNIAASNPDLTIKEGHGGTGLGGVFNFSNSPRVFNGDIIYSVNNTITNYAWTPSGSLSNSTITNPVASPTTSTLYQVVATDGNGCTNSAITSVNVNQVPLGIATATPNSICLGAPLSLSYTAPSGLQCLGATQSNFTGTYAPANWSTNQLPAASNGTIDISGAPANIKMISSNGASGAGATNYSITIPCTGILSFNWSYTTVDGPQYDYPRYSIGGSAYALLPGYITSGSSIQSGTFSINVTAGQVLSLQAYSVDNVGGSCTTTFTLFNAPIQSSSTQTIAWFPTATGSSTLGSGNPQAHTPITSGSKTFYAQVTNTSSGCTNTTRAATNAVTVNPIPTITTTATLTTICSGNFTTMTASGANTYVWNPGGLTGASVNVNPATTTTYTVTGTGVGGCTSTAIRTITVNPLPVVAGSAAPGIVCPGSSVTLTGTTPSATFHWEPGNLNGTPVIVNPTAQTTYTITVTSALGCAKTATFVILMHPTPTVTTSTTASTICTGSPTSITASGASTYSWNPGALSGATINVTPATTTTYTVTGTNAQGCTNTALRTITVSACGNSIALNLFLEGYYNGASTMKPVKMNEGIGASATIVDDITVELHNATFPYALFKTTTAILNTNGTATANFGSSVSGSYYIVVKHRNHIETWSTNPYLFSAVNSYNFTNAANKAFGSNQIQMGTNIYAFYSGDIDQDGITEVSDYSLWETDANNFQSGYLSTDLNGDGSVDISDYSFWETNANNFIGVIKP